MDASLGLRSVPESDPCILHIYMTLCSVTSKVSTILDSAMLFRQKKVEKDACSLDIIDVSSGWKGPCSYSN